MSDLRRRSTSGHRSTVVGTLAIAIVATMLAAGPAPAAVSCTDPPETIAPDQLQSGTNGTGWTTIRGSSPTPFTVEVLGVMPDYIWLDIDAIVVRITGPTSFLDVTGGVFYGMSGSPVYVDGKLIGSVSYGVSYDPTIVGLTPADAMLDMIDDGAAPVTMPQRIPFDDATRRAVARSLGVSATEVVGGLRLLPATFGVSGLSPERIAELQRSIEERGSSVRVVPGGSMDANLPVDSTPFVPGEPVGSVLSWGDFTVWAAGTTAIVCGDELVAYGHTLGLRRDVTVGMTGVNVLSVGSGGGLFPGDMVPALTEPRGVFEHDSFAGQSGTVGVEIPAAPITSQITSLDTGESRDGTTEAIHHDDWWLQYIVWGHHVLNAGALQQGYGPGSMDLEWTIAGTRQDGTPFAVTNYTLVASTYDATEALYRMLFAIDQLVYQSFEDIEFTSFDTTSTITEDQLLGEIVQVRTSSSVDRKLAERDTVRARPGERVTVEVTLASAAGDGSPTVVTFTVRAPRRGDRRVEIRGGRERYNARAESFDELIERLSGGEHSSDLIVEATGHTRVFRQTLMVQGRGSFRIQVV